MNKQEAQEELKSLPGVSDVRDGSTGSVKAIDFRLFDLHRPTDTSNFVFGSFGVRFHGGLLRLPRVPKDEYTADEVRQSILQSVPGPFRGGVSVRLTPEVQLDEDYHHPHIETPEGSVRDSIEIVRGVASNYRPL